VTAAHNSSFQKLLNTAQVNLADGVGLKIGYFLRHPFAKIPFETIHGIDFMIALCGEAEQHDWSVGLLGGMHGVAEKTKNDLLRRFPKLKVDYVQGDTEYNFVGGDLRVAPQDGQTGRSVPTIPIDILFVALGSPKEQIWISENKEKFPAIIFMQVGGAFDMLSGMLPRAPRFMQRLGLEWMWRLLLEPRRIFRQLRLVEFLIRYLFA
jgi:N-acetylglucosaminyldiphosphoundecaprenol N-acetyl-beta-D-mannosaminyltransferase